MAIMKHVNVWLKDAMRKLGKHLKYDTGLG